MPHKKPISHVSNTELTGELLPGAAAVAELSAAIDASMRVEEFVRHADTSRQLAIKLDEEGYGASVVTRMLSSCNDRITLRILAWAATRFRMPAASWCWLGLGSEGRMEQTLVTDQDNGLIFAASDLRETHALRELLLPFSRAVNETLAECGFPLCDGDIMASNPQWCLSLDEWRDCFGAWIRTPEPEALLNATIFFDFRPLAGDFSLAHSLRRYLTELACRNEIFLRMMAENALNAEAPLGRIKDFVTDAEFGDSLDLKKAGSRLFVDAARIFALADGVMAVSTEERLAGSVAKGGLRLEGVAAMKQAFLAIQAMRLQVQRTQFPAPSAGNRVVPEHLNEFERRVLLESFRQARSFQRQLKVRFKIEG
jgi:CBS domain-containing protein